MTIAQAFNEIAVAQGGTASKSGSITDAIDALNDALAGSDQAAAQTIEGAVRMLGAHIGGGGGGGGEEYNIKCYNVTGDQQLAQRQDVFAIGTWDESQHKWTASGEVVTKAKAGDVLTISIQDEGALVLLLSAPSQDSIIYPVDTQNRSSFVMPAHDVCAVLAL